MGCIYETESMNRERLIEILVEKKKRSVLLKVPSTSDSLVLAEKKCKEVQEEFYRDINDESKLIKYLESLQSKENKEKFEYELLLYFDSLSPINKTKFTGINGFDSCIDIFKKIIKDLGLFRANEIKKSKYFKDLSALSGRDKLLNSKDFSFKTKYSIQNEEKNYLNTANFINSFINNKRRQQKISLKNPELYFCSLLQSYFSSIEIASQYRLKEIGRIASSLYNPINSFLDRINQKEKFSDNEEKMIKILLFAPILGDNKSDIYRLKISFDKDYIDNNEICLKNSINDKLILKHIYHPLGEERKIENSFIIEKPNIYNISLLKKDLLGELSFLEKISKRDLIPYVKLEHFQENNFYMHDNIYRQFNSILFKYILQSNTLRTLLSNFYPNKIYIFDKEEIINELFNSIIFVPFPIYEGYCATNKKDLSIFINGLISSFFSPILYLSKSCSFIILGLHEGCSHWASAYYSFLYQDNSLYRSIKFSKELLIDIGFVDKDDKDLEKKIIDLVKLDGGEILEIILFGRKLQYFTLSEALFLLCRKSYDVDYKTFNKNYREVNSKDFFVLFQEVIKDANLINLLKSFNIDWNFFQELFRENKLNFSFKRNGEIISNSRCGNIIF